MIDTAVTAANITDTGTTIFWVAGIGFCFYGIASISRRRFYNLCFRDFCFNDFRFHDFCFNDFRFRDFCFRDFCFRDFCFRDFCFHHFCFSDFCFCNFYVSDFRFCNFYVSSFRICVLRIVISIGNSFVFSIGSTFQNGTTLLDCTDRIEGSFFYAGIGIF